MSDRIRNVWMVRSASSHTGSFRRPLETPIARNGHNGSKLNGTLVAGMGRKQMGWMAPAPGI
jgi:hypothetical protein